MSFFDQPYYSLNKSLMSHIGIWPEQSKTVRNIKPLAVFIMIMSVNVLTLIRLHDVWGDVDQVIIIVPPLLCAVINFATVLNSVQKGDEMKFMLEKIETHWKMFKHTPAGLVLDKYAERGRFLTTVYSMGIYIIFTLYCAISILPAILDLVFPLNETRPRNYLFEAEYGVDQDQYYWYIFAHGYIVSVVGINVFLAIDTMYIMWVEHACALFEIVGFKLKLITTEKYTLDKENPIAVRCDEDYRKIRECIIIHKEAISFANMIENIYSGSMIIVIGITTLLISVTGAEAVIRMGNPDVLIQLASFTSGQIFHLYFNSIPGQKLMEHSQKIHTFACEVCWYEMPTKAQKLLIPILVRSTRPCLLTAGRVYVLSMESFASVMQKAISYLTVFAQLLQTF